MQKIFILMMGALWALIFVSQADAQIRRTDTRVVPLQADDAQKRWDEFKRARTVNYCMDFTIEHAPRKGESTYFGGTIYSLNVANATFTRILVWSKDSEDSEKLSAKPVADFLLENSPSVQKVWKFDGTKAVELKKSDWTKPMAKGLVYSPFDLLTPYKNWKVRYAGPGRIGQAVHYYDLFAPADFISAQKDEDHKIENIRIALSRDFNAPVAALIYGAYGRLLKTLSLGSVKKIEGTWIVSKLELRNDLTRQKDILRFTAAKMRPALPSEYFLPEHLGKVPEKPILEEF